MCYYDYAVHLAAQAAAQYDFEYDYADEISYINEAEAAARKLEFHPMYDQSVFGLGGDEAFNPGEIKAVLTMLGGCIKNLGRCDESLFDDDLVDGLKTSLTLNYREAREALMRGRAMIARGTLVAMVSQPTPVYSEF